MEAMGETLTQMLNLGTSLVSWCVSTFPVNVSIAGGVLAVVIRTIKKGKRIA